MRRIAVPGAPLQIAAADPVRRSAVHRDAGARPFPPASAGAASAPSCRPAASASAAGAARRYNHAGWGRTSTRRRSPCCAAAAGRPRPDGRRAGAMQLLCRRQRPHARRCRTRTATPPPRHRLRRASFAALVLSDRGVLPAQLLRGQHLAAPKLAPGRRPIAVERRRTGAAHQQGHQRRRLVATIGQRDEARSANRWRCAASRCRAQCCRSRLRPRSAPRPRSPGAGAPVACSSSASRCRSRARWCCCARSKRAARSTAATAASRSAGSSSRTW